MTGRYCLSKRYLLSVTLVVLAGLSDATSPPVAHAATLLVGAPSLSCNSNGAYLTIQSAVNAASPGDTIDVCAGTYPEQVVVAKSDLTIRGAGASATRVRPMVVVQNTTSLLAGSPVTAVLLVNGATNVAIANLTVDAIGAGSGADLGLNCPAVGFLTGIFFRGGSGSVDTAQVTNVTSSTVCGMAIRGENANLMITRSLISQYSEAGLACAGPISNCTITGNMIRGQGPVSDQVQTGIQIRAAAAGSISGNKITDHFLIGAKGVPNFSVGIFLAYAQSTSNPHLIRDNIFSNNQVNVQRVGSASAF